VPARAEFNVEHEREEDEEELEFEAALVGLRTATIGLDVHFLGAVREGRITCSAEVVHRTRRIATVEARVHDGDGNLVAMGTGTFRIFEKRGDPIV